MLLGSFGISLLTEEDTFLEVVDGDADEIVEGMVEDAPEDIVEGVADGAFEDGVETLDESTIVLK